MGLFKEQSPSNFDSGLSRHTRKDMLNGFWRTIQVILSVALLVWTLLWTTAGSFGLQTVSLVDANKLIQSLAANDRMLMIASISLCIFLFTTIDTSSISSRKKVDLLQLVGSILLVTACFGFLFFFSIFQFADISSDCAQRGCFPQPMQEILLSAPVVIASILMFIFSLNRRRVHWLTRGLLPVAIFCVAALFQSIIWDSVIIPFLLSN